MGQRSTLNRQIMCTSMRIDLYTMIDGEEDQHMYDDVKCKEGGLIG